MSVCLCVWGGCAARRGSRGRARPTAWVARKSVGPVRTPWWTPSLNGVLWGARGPRWCLMSDSVRLPRLAGSAVGSPRPPRSPLARESACLSTRWCTLSRTARDTPLWPPRRTRAAVPPAVARHTGGGTLRFRPAVLRCAAPMEAAPLRVGGGGGDAPRAWSTPRILRSSSAPDSNAVPQLGSAAERGRGLKRPRNVDARAAGATVGARRVYRPVDFLEPHPFGIYASVNC